MRGGEAKVAAPQLSQKRAEARSSALQDAQRAA
jgi:hypothetical protein